MTHIRIIIVGGGPAGSTCGYILRKNGIDCLIVDKSEFPRDKLCGGGLTPKAHILLDRIFGGLKYDYHSVRTMDIYMHNKFYCTFNLNTEIRTILRREFDTQLLGEYTKLGGQKITGRVISIEEKEGKVFLTMDNGQKLSCDILIGADGAVSIVRRYLQPNYKKGIVCVEKTVKGNSRTGIQVIFDKRFDNGYMYVFPNKVGNIVGYGHKATSVEEFKDLMKEYDIADNEKVKGAYIPMLEKINYPFRKNILLIGDAGGYADSMTGEGLYYAVKTGENAARSIMENKDFYELSASVIKEVRTIRLMSILFYFRPVQKLFLWMCTKSALCKRINRAVNRYLKWEKS
jgi:geranylgeranyl reductase family protein